MKKWISILIFLPILTCTSITALASKSLPGYIITANNDTLTCKIKGGRFLSDPFKGVTIINEDGTNEFLPSRDKKIIGFGFTENLTSYHFMFIEVGDKKENGFYQRVVSGKKYKLYYRPKLVSDGLPIYVLFNQNDVFRKIEPCPNCPWKKQLRELLKDDSAALAHVENASRVNIPKFVIELNKL